MKNIRDKKADKDVEIISHDIAYQGYFRIEKIKRVIVFLRVVDGVIILIVRFLSVGARLQLFRMIQN